MNTQYLLSDIDRAKAATMYKEYHEGCKRFPAHKGFKIMKSTLKAIEEGNSIIDLSQVIQNSGTFKDTGYPRIAIAPIEETECIARLFKGGSITYGLWERNHWNRYFKGFIKIRDILDKRKSPALIVTQAPDVPPSLMPNSTKGYYKLWEAEEWEVRPIPPPDPLLLKRIEGTRLFIVVAAWDLTKLEQLVMSATI